VNTIVNGTPNVMRERGSSDLGSRLAILEKKTLAVKETSKLDFMEWEVAQRKVPT